MESCARVIGLFPEYAEGELPPLQADRVESHLRGCGPCAIRVRRQRTMVAALEHLPQVVPPVHLRESVMARIAADPLPIPASRRSHLRLVRILFWITLGGLGGATGLAGARLLGREVARRTLFLDPSFYGEWVENAGRVAFSFLLEIATRAQISGALSSPRGALAWGGAISGLLFAGLAAGALGVGLLATARLLLTHHRGR